MQLSIIIVSYNVKYFLEQCLASVQRAIESLQAEVFVIDNCSTDGTIDLQTNFSSVHFIKNSSNEGFAKANNTALKLCKGEYVLFLNPDTIIPEHILNNCRSFFETYKDAGAVGVQMLDGSGTFLQESKRAFPSPAVSFNKLSGLAALFPKSSVFNKYALGNLDKDSIHEVDVLSGAFMMVENNLLQQLNGFDESFFMYGEDIDLSYRVQQTGKKNYYLGNLKIIHFKGESIGEYKSKHTKIFYDAMHVFVKKYYKGFSGFLMRILLQSGIFIRSGISFFVLPFKVAASQKDFAVKTFCLIGDANSCAEAEKILHQSIKKNLNIEKKEAVSKTSANEIIFCIGTFSFAETVDFIRQHPGKYFYNWHALNTGSIVGSTDKNSSGTVYEIDKETLLNIAEQYTERTSE